MRGRWPVQLARGAGVVVLAVLVGVGVRQGWFPEWNWIERVSWLAGIVGVVVALLALRKPQQRPARTPRQDRRFLPDPRQELKVFAGTGWSSTLRELYPGTKLVTFGGREFPIWAELADPADRADLDSPLGQLTQDIEPSFDHYNRGTDASGHRSREFDPAGAEEYAYLQRTADLRSKHNGAAYAFTRLRRVDGRLRVDAAPGTYFDSVATSELLEREFVRVQSRQPGRAVDLRQLPRRRWLHERVAALAEPADVAGPGVVFDGRLRAAALSVAVTMIVADGKGGHTALLIPRSDKVLTHPGFVHVAPSGIFAPTEQHWPDDWRQDFSVRRTVLREYAEELFDHDELEGNTGRYGLQAEQTPPVQRLLKAVGRKQVALRYCGISVPLLTLRPEIDVLIFVRDPEWFREEMRRARRKGLREFQPNWEYRSARDVIWLRLKPDFTPYEDDVIDPARMVPHAAASLSLATRVARQMGPGS
jgi:hypothetical protein